MMPELGKYAAEVLSAYAVTLGLLLALVLVSVARARRVKGELEEIEHRSKTRG
ncbi:heme exporter protein CcmD [uncultured Lentibacter sp.]|uniref:heme exporter protein CcmD n=1 Tax=uncultured Lentibacter sp. TaxID=1659309 RepID=UPI00262E2240|nr:heme exporter protein CcmD [uncultured Lentibacter sp.]